jgi:hypothetical protein
LHHFHEWIAGNLEVCVVVRGRKPGDYRNVHDIFVRPEVKIVENAAREQAGICNRRNDSKLDFRSILRCEIEFRSLGCVSNVLLNGW